MMGGSSGWGLGRNQTRKCNIVHLGSSTLVLPIIDQLSQIDAEHQRYLLMNCFIKPFIKSSSLSCLGPVPPAGVSKRTDNWAKLPCVIDPVHNHICSHATYCDMRTFLMINVLWNHHTLQCAVSTFTECIICKTS